MKKIIAFILGLILVVGWLCCRGEEANSYLRKVSKALDIDIKDGEIMQESDSHGGFHGDGTTLIEIKLTDQDVLRQMEERWKEMPLSENLTALVYGLQTEGYSVGPALHSGDGKPMIPEVKNGYYYFTDRHYQSTDAQDDSKVLDRYSYNFTIAIYDINTQTMYYMELNT